MKAEEFDSIENDLRKRIAGCERHLGGVRSAEDICRLTVSEVVEIRRFCKSEYLDMTKIAMVDFYHVIGMGGMSAAQTNAFVSLMRKYLSYRPSIQAFCSGSIGFDDLPKIPVRTSFRLTALAAGLELSSGPDDGCPMRDDAGLDDYRKAVTAGESKGADRRGCGGSLAYADEKTICGSLNDLGALRSELAASGVSDAFVNTIVASLAKGCPELQCAGVRWKAVGDTFVGTAKTDLAKSMFAKAYSKQAKFN